MTGDEVDPRRRLLERQYEHVLAEYRFQVELNWKRTQYFLVLNLGILVAATGLVSARQPRLELIGMLLGLGALLAAVSVFTNQKQHGYYRRTREVKRRLEEALLLGDFALATTPGMQSESAGRRPWRVRYAFDFFLVALGVVDLLALVFVVCWAGG